MESEFLIVRYRGELFVCQLYAVIWDFFQSNALFSTGQLQHPCSLLLRLSATILAVTDVPIVLTVVGSLRHQWISSDEETFLSVECTWEHTALHVGSVNRQNVSENYMH